MDLRESDMPLFHQPEPKEVSRVELDKEKIRTERQEAIFGFDDNKTVYPINNGLYGFAFFDSSTYEWYCISGSFEHLYGIYRGIHLLGNEENETKGIHYAAFFVLSINHEPLCIIPHAKMTAKQTSQMEGSEVEHDKTYRNLIMMGEKITPPKLQFEI
jgi:hypothetical protein